MSKEQLHLSEELSRMKTRVSVNTKYGKVTGGRALNGTAVFLGKFGIFCIMQNLSEIE